MKTITFAVKVDADAIQAARTLGAWVAAFDLDHDMFVDDAPNWDDIYRAVALAHLAGGDYSEFVA